MDVIHNANSNKLTVLRYAKSASKDFVAGIEVSEFIPGEDHQDLIYTFPEIVDVTGKALKWFWLSTAGMLADPVTLDMKNIYGSPVNAAFKLVSREQLGEYVRTHEQNGSENWVIKYLQELQRPIDALGLGLKL
jgi:hypothetical protein